MLTVHVLGLSITIDAPDTALRALLVAQFGPMIDERPAVPSALHYRVARHGSGATRFVTTRGDGAQYFASCANQAALDLESDITLELQRRRADLCFLHSAAVERGGKAYLLVAASGSGKSTTTWGLLHHGFRYLTDELSPVDLSSLCVSPYPYALSLKTLPSVGYPLPPGALNLGRVIHVPTQCLPAAHVPTPVPVACLFFVNFRTDRRHPGIERMSVAEAGARLYTNVLNALAHPRAGLDAVVRIVQRVPSFALAAADLRATCALVDAAINEWESVNTVAEGTI